MSQVIQSLGEEERKKIEGEVLQKLQFAITPEPPKELIVIPPTAMVPIYQKLHDAPYKLKTDFKKYYDAGNKILAFVSSDAVIRIFRSGFVDMIFQARTSKKLYYYKFTKHEIYDLFPADLTTYTVDGAEPAKLDTIEDIVRDFFALELKLNSKAYKQGHLYIFEVEEQYFIEYWVRDSVEQVADHTFYYGGEVTTVLKLTDEIYYKESDKEIRIIHPEHGESVLPPGKYLFYHPRRVD